jgi:hypothetical protein
MFALTVEVPVGVIEDGSTIAPSTSHGGTVTFSETKTDGSEFVPHQLFVALKVSVELTAFPLLLQL